jgi:hypothetical protein
MEQPARLQRLPVSCFERAFLIALVGCGFHPTAATNGLDDAAPHDAREIHDAPADGRILHDGPGAPIQFRQVAFAEDIATGVETVTFANAQAAGDLSVVMVGWYKGGTVVSVTDSSHNAYALAVGPTTQASGMETQAVYYACNIAAALAGANTVTVTFQDANQDPDVRIAEYSGIVGSGCVDRTVAATGTGTAIDSGSLTTTHAHDLLVGSNKVFNLTSAGDPAYTTRRISGFGDLVEDREVTTTGNYHAAATENMTGGWVMQLVAFAGD